MDNTIYTSQVNWDEANNELGDADILSHPAVSGLDSDRQAEVLTYMEQSSPKSKADTYGDWIEQAVEATA